MPEMSALEFGSLRWTWVT